MEKCEENVDEHQTYLDAYKISSDWTQHASQKLATYSYNTADTCTDKAQLQQKQANIKVRKHPHLISYNTVVFFSKLA